MAHADHASYASARGAAGGASAAFAIVLAFTVPRRCTPPTWSSPPTTADVERCPGRLRRSAADFGLARMSTTGTAESSKTPRSISAEADFERSTPGRH
jgi:hypothetical protein